MKYVTGEISLSESEDREQRTEDSGQRTGNRGLRTEDSGLRGGHSSVTVEKGDKQDP